MSAGLGGSASDAGRTGLPHELSGLAIIAQRDVIKLLRDRPRLAVNLAFPILLIGGLGSVLQPTVGRVTGLNAVTLAFTGVLAASLFQSAAAGHDLDRRGPGERLLPRAVRDPGDPG